MRIMAFDLDSYRTGFVCGLAGSKPRVQTWLLRRKGDPVSLAIRNLACSIRDNIQFETPDLIAAEDFMNPQAQRSADAVIASLELHGALEALAALWGIPVKRTHVDTIRKHFCGRSTATPRTRGTKTARQKADARAATKQMVINRAITLGYLPRGCQDDDKADACAIFDFACATYANVRPSELVMFGETINQESCA